MADTLSLTLGAIEMGTMISVQAYMYAVGCRDDKTWTKAVVAFVWCVSGNFLHAIITADSLAGLSKQCTSSP